ncbi:hypothetical protein [Turicibacter sanguinis]|uniref:hypothetical protein n=1 Tax=Turicibacter sanguinis TaxID=154288 RepID=UPI00232DE9E8|nr:hypothetical protein [Turicibacter sanguinis]MDB8570641.1 hypothetical protein [Turicibacter sanguinis]MDB8573394.1 hypothetical protein [Turicibacter sanguinis]
MFIILICIILKRITYKKIIIICSLITITTTSLIYTENMKLNFKDLIYFYTFILFVLVISDESLFKLIKYEFSIKTELIKRVLIVSNIILFLSFFNPTSYYTSWGENGRYFKGLTVMPQVMASISLLILLMTIYFFKNNTHIKYQFLLYIIPIISILATGARSYLIPLIFVLLGYFIKNFGYIKTLLIVILASPLIISVFLKSSIYGKFLYVLEFEYSNSLFSSLTSGRSDVWINCFNHYISEYSIIEKLIGSSFDNVYSIINHYTSMNIWAHNDIVNTLMSSGLVGVFIYLYTFMDMKKIFMINNSKKISFLLFLITFSCIMLTNGLFVSITSTFAILLYILI